MIEKIKLVNFKCFDEIEIPLNKLTLLAGGNGSGKSTIIQALLLIAQSYNGNNKISQIDFMGKYVKLGYSNDIYYEFNDKEPIITLNLTFKDKNRIQLSSNYESQKSSLKCECAGEFYGNESLVNGNFEYIAADRISPEKVFSVFSNDDNLGIHGEYVMNYISSYGLKPILEEICNNQVENTLVSQLDYWLSRLFNGFCLKFEEVLKSDTISLRFQEVSRSDRSNEHRPINVGFGITYVLPVLVALLKAKKDDLVIIENPECHLHPKAQRIIGEMIAKVSAAGVQIIVETHSDHVLNGIRLSVKKKIINQNDTQVLFVAREDIGTHFHTNVYAPNILENGDLDVWPEGFFDEWDNALISLLE